MRFFAAAWVGMLDDGAWLRRAGHANAMARRLADAVRPIAGVRVLFPVEANAVFLGMSPRSACASARRSRSYRFRSCCDACLQTRQRTLSATAVSQPTVH